MFRKAAACAGVIKVSMGRVAVGLLRGVRAIYSFPGCFDTRSLLSRPRGVCFVDAGWGFYGQKKAGWWAGVLDAKWGYAASIR